ncbi:MAG: chorismate-binding protein [Psychroserpens sp.]|nr:chorismate-binding protein [Psychroserpens sp.]
MLQDDFFLSLENHYKSNLPFVAYRHPNNHKIKGFLQTTSDLYLSQNFKESGFVFAPFNGLIKTVILPLEHCEILSCNSEIKTSNIEFNNRGNYQVDGKEQHIELVQKGVESIKKGDFKKVVLSRCETIDFSKQLSISVFKQLLQTYSNAFVYCWFHPDVGLWLGATPEVLLSITGNHLKTMALAGTQRYKDSLVVNWGEKELEEQKFVTDFIEEQLKPLVSHIKISEPKTVRAGNLLHLQSDINCVLETDLQTVLEHLHPTPAVCGLPVNTSKTFILNHEYYHRDYYTGFLGELNLKETTSRNTNRRNVENNAYSSVKTVSHLYVNLRCMQIKNNQALIYVGGGVTKDSNPEDEWQETVSKAETMKRVLMS